MFPINVCVATGFNILGAFGVCVNVNLSSTVVYFKCQLAVTKMVCSCLRKMA